MVEPLTFYIAGRYSRRSELLGYARMLEEIPGVRVRAEWLNGSHQPAHLADQMDANLEETSHPMKAQWAYADLQNIEECDVMLLFTEGIRRGGAHVEYGYALALNKQVHVIGPLTTVFHSFAIAHGVGPYRVNYWPGGWRDFYSAAVALRGE